jgi:hypothetical protein
VFPSRQGATATIAAVALLTVTIVRMTVSTTEGRTCADEICESAAQGAAGPSTKVGELLRLVRAEAYVALTNRDQLPFRA